jgi:hypothetical protein
MKKLFLLLLLAVPCYAQDWSSEVKVKINAPTSQGQFQDAIQAADLTVAERTELARVAQSGGTIAPAIKASIDAKVKARIDNWKAFVVEQSSKPPVVQTKEELIEQSKSQTDQLSTFVTKFIESKPTKEEAQALVDKLKASMDSLAAVSAVAVDEKPIAEEVIK